MNTIVFKIMMYTLFLGFATGLVSILPLGDMGTTNTIPNAEKAAEIIPGNFSIPVPIPGEDSSNWFNSFFDLISINWLDNLGSSMKEMLYGGANFFDANLRGYMCDDTGNCIVAITLFGSLIGILGIFFTIWLVELFTKRDLIK